jgi:hypothetical protein
VSPRAALAVLAALVGCGGRTEPVAAPVPVQGPSRDLRTLTGDWSGEFLSSAGDRRGIVVFALGAGRDTAQGYVVVEALPAPRPSPDDGAMVLRFGTVVVAEGSIAGWIQSYPDFELGCPVDTWFEGRMAGDTLRGMFFAHPLAGDTVRRGTWWAARR